MKELLAEFCLFLVAMVAAIFVSVFAMVGSIKLAEAVFGL